MEDFVKQEVSKTGRNLMQNSYFYKTSKIVNNENVKTFFRNFQKQFVILPIDKAANNFSFICKKLYMSKIFNEVELNGTPNSTYEFARKPKDRIIRENISFINKLGLNLNENR